MPDFESHSASAESRLLTRRKFLRGATASAFVATGLTGAYEWHYEGDRLVVTRADVHLPHWPREADGLRIGQLSDFHADYDHAVKRTSRAVAMLLREKPDIVLVTGDYVTSHYTRRLLAPTIDALKPLNEVPRGTYAVMGNHDHWGSNAQIATRLLRNAGITVLNNASVAIAGVPGAYIVGVDDPWCDKMDLDKALHRVPKHAPKLIAMHEPDFADVVGEGFDLQLSGHSHGGQIRVPGLPVIYVPGYSRQYPEGLQQAKNHLVYTTRGIGMVGPQVRVFCPPEVTLLTIRISPAPA
ncbi:MAG TPA: metallophosphoesterase [Capsulimonadaceae bacterium]|jgi:hypothetical protein